VVGVRSRWDSEGRLLASGLALQFKSLGSAATRARRRLAAAEAQCPPAGGKDV
jgi:hypothetical protein